MLPNYCDGITKKNTYVSTTILEDGCLFLQDDISLQILNTKYGKMIEDDNEAEEFRIKNRMADYHISFFQEASTKVLFEGKKVLEIGGSNMPRELIFGKLNADKWVSVDKPWDEHYRSWGDHYKSLKKVNSETDLEDVINENDYLLFNAYTDEINESFWNRFDVVISNCCFEHIQNVADALEKIWRSLKKGGCMFAQFGPIWSCKGGSHYIWTDDLRFGNPGRMSDYAHLLLSLEEIYSILEVEYPQFSYEERCKIAYDIKNGNEHGVNRLFFEDYCLYLLNSKFDKWSLFPYSKTPIQSEVFNTLCMRYPQYKRFDIWGCELSAIK